ncbi:MAG: hypothetical protein Q7K40_03520 [bacterium]|nr:hypothetical protein [bacterium]
MYRNTMAEQMIRNMQMRGEVGGIISSNDGQRTMPEQVLHNMKLRGEGLPKGLNSEETVVSKK